MIKKTIFVTHNSVFHADEAMATAILIGVFGDQEVVRTNDPSEYENNDEAIIYDIGFGKYDHHQEGGNGTRDNGVPYAACGLIWNEYADIYIKNITSSMNLHFDDEDYNRIAKIVDSKIIEGIDANDNGYHPDPVSSINYYNISNIVSSFNNISRYGGAENDFAQHLLFNKAVEFCFSVLHGMVIKVADSINSEKELQDRINKKRNKHILVLNEYIPWIRYVVENDKDAWYVIFPSSRNKGEWNMQAVPVAVDTFEQRHPVPKSWWGGNKKTLPAITGVKTASFCHRSSGFLTAAGNRKDILALARLACKEE